MPAKTKSATPWPMYTEWRDGRPRWNASPKLKKLGFRGFDLKDGAGAYLDAGPAIALGHRINAAVAAWPGEPIPAEFKAFAPVGACEPGAIVPTKNERSLGYLYDAYIEAAKVQPRTLRNYRNGIRIMLKTVAELREVSLQDVRAQDVELLRPPRFGKGGRYDLRLAYEEIRAKRGVSMAKGCIDATSAWFRWIKFERFLWEGDNPCQLVERTMPKGRKVAFSQAEIEALIEVCDATGRASMADAIILGLDTTWSKQDLLATPWVKQPDGTNWVDGFTLHGQRIKTGVTMVAELLPPFPGKWLSGRARKRLAEIRLRQALWSDDERAKARGHVLVNEATGGPWNEHSFCAAFDKVRALAAETAGEALLTKQFRDIRDTAISLLEGGAAGIAFTKMQIAARCGHSYESVASMTDGAYSERVTIAAETMKLLREATPKTTPSNPVRRTRT